MDNQNNPNPPNNPTPAEPTPPLPPPGATMPDWLTPPQPDQPQSGITPLPSDAESMLPPPAPPGLTGWSPSEPTPPPVEATPFPPAPAPAWPADSTQSGINASASDNGSMPDLSSTWTPPTQFAPATPPPAEWPASTQSQPSPDMTPPQDQTPAWTPPVQTLPQSEPVPAVPEPLIPQPPSSPEPTQSEPTPTFTPLTAASPTGEEPTLSPIDNPWKAPTQPAPPDQTPDAIQPSWTNIPGSQTENQTEAAPTDLSHLIGNNNSQQEPSAQTASETLVVPPAPIPDVPTLPAENHKGMPKWLIGLGVGLLILVAGASAFLILGIGQPSKTTTSLPATVTPKTAEVKPPLPIATPVPQATVQPASGSANFGELGGNAGGGTPTTPATSAAELLRQRQLGR